MASDELVLGGMQIKNRLLFGTGKFSSYSLMREAIEAIRPDIVTVALRRVDEGRDTDNILEFIPRDIKIMVNTSGARTAEEAARIARLARESGGGEWIKVEVIQDNKYLLPDNLETLKAVEILVKDGFVVLPYMSPDLSMARRMADAGASAIMPLGSPIGSNRGVKTRELVKILVNEIKIPVIVDAGLGRPSDACECMELGCAAVLVNTAIAIAKDPIAMSKAFSEAVSAGRKAYLSGIAEPNFGEGDASSPLTGFLR